VVGYLPSKVMEVCGGKMMKKLRGREGEREEIDREEEYKFSYEIKDSGLLVRAFYRWNYI